MTTKKDCMKCKYRGKIGHGFGTQLTEQTVFCNYLGVTLERRPCPARECTVFEKGRQEKTKSIITLKKRLQRLKKP